MREHHGRSLFGRDHVRYVLFVPGRRGHLRVAGSTGRIKSHDRSALRATCLGSGAALLQLARSKGQDCCWRGAASRKSQRCCCRPSIYRGDRSDRHTITRAALQRHSHEQVSPQSGRGRRQVIVCHLFDRPRAQRPGQRIALPALLPPNLPGRMVARGASDLPVVPALSGPARCGIQSRKSSSRGFRGQEAALESEGCGGHEDSLAWN